MINGIKESVKRTYHKPTKKLKMAEEKNVASSSRPKKSKLPENMGTPSNLRHPLRRINHKFYFSNTVNDPIEVEEVEDPSKSSELAFGEEASSEENSKNISSAPGKIETTKDSLDENATVFGEDQYEHTSQPTPSFPSICSPSLPFFYTFRLSTPYIFHFSRLYRGQLFK